MAYIGLYIFLKDFVCTVPIPAMCISIDTFFFLSLLSVLRPNRCLELGLHPLVKLGRQVAVDAHHKPIGLVAVKILPAVRDPPKLVVAGPVARQPRAVHLGHHVGQRGRLPVSLPIVLERYVPRAGERDRPIGQGRGRHAHVNIVLDLMGQLGIPQKDVERLAAQRVGLGDGHARLSVLGGLDAPPGLHVVGHESPAVAQEFRALEEFRLGRFVGQDGAEGALDLAAVVAELLAEDDAEEGAGGVDLVVEGGVTCDHLLGELGIDPGGLVSFCELAGGAGLSIRLSAAGIADHATGLDLAEIVLGTGRGFGEFGCADLGFDVGYHDGGIFRRRWGDGRRRRRWGRRAAQHDEGVGRQLLDLVVHPRLLGLHGEVGPSKD